MSIQLMGARTTSGPGQAVAYSGPERRRATRYEAVRDRIWLGWWDGDEFQTLGARLLDISRTGAAIVCPDGPELAMDAWFCVVGPTLSGGARTRVVAREPMPGMPGQIRLRMEFQPICPEDLYLVALDLLNEESFLDMLDRQSAQLGNR